MVKRKQAKSDYKVELPQPGPNDTEGQYDAIVANRAETLTAIQEAAPLDIWDTGGEAAELRVLGLVVMPEEYSTLLYADPFSTDKLCKKGILQKEPAPWTNQPDVKLRYLSPEEYFFASFRGNGAWWKRTMRYFPNPAKQELRFRLKWAATRTTNSPAPAPGNPDFLQIMPGQETFFKFNIADCAEDAGGSTFATECNTRTMVCGRSKDELNDHRWVWCNAVPDAEAADQSQWTVTYSDTTNGVSTPCTIEAFRWNGGDPKSAGKFEFTVAGGGPPAGTVSVSVKLTGATGIPDFYTFKYAVSAVTDTNFANGNGFRFDFVSKCSGLTLTPVENAYQNVFQLGKGTMIAGSCRFTDMAPPLGIQGECTVACLREPYAWYQMYTSRAPFARINNYRDSYTGKLLNGGYAYHLPFRSTQFEMQECVDLNYDAQVINDIWWDIEDDSNVNVFGARSINTGTNNGLTGQGCDGWITTVSHFNWYTDNKWPDAGLAEYSYTIWASALTNLRFAPRVMSNNHHSNTLFSWMLKTGRLAKKYAPAILKLAQRSVPIISEGARLLQDAYSTGNEITRTLKGGGM